MTHNPLGNIVYISVPEELERSLGAFTLDPSVLLPVETTGPAERWDPAELSWEMIIAAMLKILAYEPDHDDAGYYREFINAVKPDVLEELTNTAIVKAQNEQFEIAEEIFRAIRGLAPGNQRTALNLALLFEQRAEHTENTELRIEFEESAAEIYHELVSGTEDVIPDVNLYAGYFFLKTRDFERALHHLRAYVDDGDDDEKIRTTRKTIEEVEEQNLQDTLFKEAYDFIRMGREDDGVARARIFVEKNPDIWNGWFLLGWGLRRLEKYAEARDAFLKVVQLGQSSVDTLNELAICLMELDEFAEAEKNLLAALRAEPENTKVMANLGVLAMKKGELEEARRFFEVVLEFDPDDTLTQQLISQLPDAE